MIYRWRVGDCLSVYYDSPGVPLDVSVQHRQDKLMGSSYEPMQSTRTNGLASQGIRVPLQSLRQLTVGESSGSRLGQST